MDIESMNPAETLVFLLNIIFNNLKKKNENNK
jgi:hypothetical protein